MIKTKAKYLIAILLFLVAFILFNTNIVKASDIAIGETKNVSLKEALILKGYDTNSDKELSKDEMQQIKDIYISDVNIIDLTGLGDAINLERLDINGNNKNIDLTPLENLTNLEVLNLANYDITDISILKNLTNLKRIGIVNAYKLSDISVVKELTALESLQFVYCNVQDISAVKNLTNLETLSLSGNRVTNIDVLKNLTNLTSLYLPETGITDISVLANLTELWNLSLFSNKIKDISALENLTNLKYLLLNDNEITDIKALKNLSQLIHLDISYNYIEDFSYIENKNIERLVTTPQKTDEIPEKPEENIITTVNDETNIKLEAIEGIIPDNTVLDVKEVKEENYNAIQDLIPNIKNFKVFDINLLSEGEKIQPNGKVKVSIPVPEGLDISNLVIYRINEDGTKTEYAVTVETVDNIQYATFETDHFSTYVLGEQISEQIEQPTNNENNTETTAKGEKDETPKTGATATIAGITALVILIGTVVIIKKCK